MSGRKCNNSMKTQIAVMKTKVDYIEIAIKKIEKSTENLPGWKADITWLKYWHNIIVIGVIASLIIGLLLGFPKVVSLING